MEIVYQDNKSLEQEQLERLFLSVGWSSGHFPEKLQQAIAHSATVFSAWEGERLVGLVNALDDRVMTAYIHYLLVDPAFQGRGIGRALIGRMREVYRDYLRIVLVAYEKEKAFYERNGFSAGEKALPMFVTSLWT